MPVVTTAAGSLPCERGIAERVCITVRSASLQPPPVRFRLLCFLELPTDQRGEMPRCPLSWERGLAWTGALCGRQAGGLSNRCTAELFCRRTSPGGGDHILPSPRPLHPPSARPLYTLSLGFLPISVLPERKKPAATIGYYGVRFSIFLFSFCSIAARRALGRLRTRAGRSFEYKNATNR